MSGLEPIAALGLACNVMQVISFSHQTISICKRIYRGDSIDQGLSSIADNLDNASLSLQQHLSNLPQAATKDETELIKLAKECSQASDKVRAEMKRYTSKKGGKLEALKLGIKKTWNQRDLEKVEEELSRCQKAMENRILVRICTKQDALSLVNDQGFQTFDQTLKNFIQRFSQGNTKLEKLIDSHADSIKKTLVQQREISDQHVTQQHVDTHNLVYDESNKTRQQILDTTAVQIDRLKREKLLGSLNFSGRNERFNNIKEAHYESFNWLFGRSEESYDVSAPSSNSPDDQGSKDWVLEDLPTSPAFGRGRGRERSDGNDLMAHLLRLLPTVANKSYDTDWSETELRKSLFGILGVLSQKQRLCIFLDGLDEVFPDDGPDKLLRLIRDIWSPYPDRIKLCVSSREEVVFKKDLKSHPSLRLEQLSAPDIYRYAFNSLAEFASKNPLGLSLHLRWSFAKNKSFYPHSSQLLAETIVEKSEGVFLWVYLAIKSLERANCNMDPANVIQKRLEAMPKDLKDLYGSMWKRLNDDGDLYEADAALYFNLVIDYSDQNITTWFENFLAHSSPTLGHISIAREVIATFERDENIIGPPFESIASSCQVHYQGVQTRCAGLLEFTPKVYQATPQSGQEFLYPDMEVNFIHRTAKEFLLQTAEGQKILNKDNISADVRLASIIHSWLLRGWTLHSPKHNGDQRLHFYSPNLRPWCEDLLKSYSKLPEARKREWVESWHSILQNMPKSWSGFEKDITGQMAAGMLHDFVSISFRQPDLYTAQYKTYILKRGAGAPLDSPLYNDGNTRIKPELLIHEWLKTIDLLLSRGCEPQKSPQPMPGSENTILLPHNEPLIEFVRSIFLFAELQQITTYGNGVEDKIVQILQKLIKTQSDLSQEIYGFFRKGVLQQSSERPLEITSSKFFGGSENVVFLVLPVGQLLRRLSQSMPHTVLGKGVAELLSSWKPEEPEILAIGFGYLPWWSRSARRVDKVLEKQLLEVIMRENPPAETCTKGIESQLQSEIDGLIEGYDFNGVEPEDLTNSLIIERGLQETLPETLHEWLSTDIESETWQEIWERRYPMPTKFASDAEFEEEDHTR